MVIKKISGGKVAIFQKQSGIWRLMMLPRVEGKSFIIRIHKIFADCITHPIKNLKTIFVDDWAKRTQILLFMQTLDST
ncbi:MAG TPA: hypothetical protein EYO79_06780 [Candidatus Marinimicrobia bacterium]|nr:hypothetical protein [Candidatus Neomarinimicrobiota bacterium]